MHETLTINGVRVLFPVKPYRCQLMLMNKIILALQASENCLLESPTGSGKTLALLCSTLAWQRQQIEENEALVAKLSSAETADNVDLDAIKHVPKIYYGTRTHKQIDQIIKQLRLTAYGKRVKMTILSSRENTCIHPVVSKSLNKTEECKNLCRPENNEQKCEFNNSKIKDHEDLYSILNAPFDIEDIVKVGKSKRTCPFFLIRSLVDQAEIVFCPYNFLIDPRTRSNVNLSLKNNVIILDEAHNIEDQAREALSFKIPKLYLDSCASEVNALKYVSARMKSDTRNAILFLVEKLVSLSEWLDENCQNLQQADINSYMKVVSSLEIIKEFYRIGFGPMDHRYLVKQITTLLSDESIESLGESSRNLLEELWLLLDVFYGNDLSFIDDYKIVLKKEQTPSVFNMEASWSDMSNENNTWSCVLHFVCLNPAVAFTKFSSAHSIMVLSGTLAPITSFQGELGLNFKHNVEADHVVPPNRIFIANVPLGPNRVPLHCSYRISDTFTFQDEIGEIVCKICESVLFGVLCFFSSYRILNKITARWMQTGLWKKLAACKKIFIEPRKADEFQSVILEYREINSCPVSKETITGALFFGVFRGRASEGLDFEDNIARCVITIGLPYPNVKDLNVELKRQYNDAYSSTKKLLSGDEWYEIQAFRALNQALGRCLRHKNDWGSIILVEERFSSKPERTSKYMSKWIRTNLQTYFDFNEFISALSAFNRKFTSESTQSPDASANFSLSQQFDKNKDFALEKSRLNLFVDSDECSMSSLSRRITSTSRKRHRRVTEIRRNSNKLDDYVVKNFQTVERASLLSANPTDVASNNEVLSNENKNLYLLDINRNEQSTLLKSMKQRSFSDDDFV